MKRSLFYYILAIILMAGCMSKPKIDHTPLSGMIHYSVSYSDSLKLNSLYYFFPKELTSVFNGNRFKIQAKGALNMYQLELLNAGADSSFALLQLFDQKFNCPIKCKNKNEIHPLLTDATIEFHKDSVLEIAGLSSSLMTIRFNNPEHTQLSIYYARNKAMEESKGFHSLIPGIATRIVIEHTGNEVVINATEVKEQLNAKEKYVVPADYRTTTIEELNILLSVIMN